MNNLVQILLFQMQNRQVLDTSSINVKIPIHLALAISLCPRQRQSRQTAVPEHSGFNQTRMRLQLSSGCVIAAA